MSLHKPSAAILAALLLVIGVPASATTPDSVLVIADNIDNLTSLDPAEAPDQLLAEFSHHVYDRLITLDTTNPDATVQPGLASDWQVSDDGLLTTFSLRDDARFHSGNRVTAEDAAFSLQRVVKLNRAPAFVLANFGLTPQNVDERIFAQGNRLHIRTDQAYAPSLLLHSLATSIGSIVDRQLVLANEIDNDLGNAWLSRHSAGSGAYQLRQWVPGRRQILIANRDHFQGAPKIPRIVISNITRSESRLHLLMHDHTDIARALKPVDARKIPQSGNLDLVSRRLPELMYLALNQRNPKLANPEIARAIKFLPDYRLIQAHLAEAPYEIWQHPIPDTQMAAISDQPYPFDPEVADFLFNLYMPAGSRFRMGVASDPDRLVVAGFLKQAMANRGVEVEILAGPLREVLKLYQNGELDMYLGSWRAGYPDPHAALAAFGYYPTSDRGTGGFHALYNQWQQRDFNRQIIDALTTADLASRQELYRNLQQDLVQAVPVVFLFQKSEYFGLTRDIQSTGQGDARTPVSYTGTIKTSTLASSSQ